MVVQLLAFTVLTVSVLLLVRRLRGEKVKVIAVIDGDTVLVVNRRGKKMKVRLVGIDAPERGQPVADTAKSQLSDLVKLRWVTATWHGTDRYNRRLGRLWLNGRNVAATLVSRGMAYSQPGAGLHWHQAHARVRGRGVWRHAGVRPTHALHRRWPWLGTIRHSFLRARRKKR